MKPDDGILFWGLTWANVIAFIGVFVTFSLGIANYFSNKATRRRTLELDTFGHRLRTPIEKLLDDLVAVVDEADDVARSDDALAEKCSKAKSLGIKFHAVRRRVARHLTDCDKSKLVPGDDWSMLDEGRMDNATDAFSAAVRAQTLDDFRQALLTMAREVHGFRDAVSAKLDSKASHLMR